MVALFLRSVFLKSLSKRLVQRQGISLKAGFTMIELLVAILISGVLVTGLMAIVIELLGSNQRETVRTETQQEMQAALEFIASEMRESVYIYDGACLEGAAAGRTECSGLFTAANPGRLPRPADSVPILAFWKLDTLPKPLQDQCIAGSAPATVPCLSGRMHVLVVYYLSKANQNTPWKGRARILRYELPKYDSNGASVTGYVDPGSSDTTFSIWPLSRATGANLQNGTPPTNTQVLADFVDDRNPANFTLRSCPCDYKITPPESALTGSFASVRSFYACVRLPETAPPDPNPACSSVSLSGAFNQKVVLFVRGSTSGKPGSRENESGSDSLPTLQTEVLNRGVRNKIPSQ